MLHLRQELRRALSGHLLLQAHTEDMDHRIIHRHRSTVNLVAPIDQVLKVHPEELPNRGMQLLMIGGLEVQLTAPKPLRLDLQHLLAANLMIGTRQRTLGALLPLIEQRQRRHLIQDHLQAVLLPQVMIGVLPPMPGHLLGAILPLAEEQHQARAEPERAQMTGVRQVNHQDRLLTHPHPKPILLRKVEVAKTGELKLTPGLPQREEQPPVLAKETIGEALAALVVHGPRVLMPLQEEEGLPLVVGRNLVRLPAVSRQRWTIGVYRTTHRLHRLLQPRHVVGHQLQTTTGHPKPMLLRPVANLQPRELHRLRVHLVLMSGLAEVAPKHQRRLALPRQMIHGVA